VTEQDPEEATAEETPVIPLMTWEEEENGKEGQLNLPAFTDMPTLAERAVIHLAREWRESVVTNKPHNKQQGAREETIILACLLLSVRWGSAFTTLPLREVDRNSHLNRGDYGFAWMDSLGWDLCRYALSDPLDRRHLNRTIEILVANLAHGSSSVRLWVMDLGWLVKPLVPVLFIEATVNALLKNLADTLVGPMQAAALAARFFLVPEDFISFASRFRPPATFNNQYAARLADLKSTLHSASAPFVETENQCWQIITDAILGKLFVPLKLPPAVEGKDLFPHLACPEPSALPALTSAQTGLLSRLGHIWHTRYTRRELDMLVSLPWNQLPQRLKDKTIHYHDDPASLKRPEEWPTLGSPEDND